MLKNAEQLLTVKGSEIISISPDATVFDAVRKMSDNKIGALLVVDGQKTVGIISERDYARKVILMEKSSRDTPVNEIMTSNLIYAQPKHSVKECITTMTTHRIRHLPVIDNDDNLLGLLSSTDLMTAVIAEQEFLIEQLEHYISG